MKTTVAVGMVLLSTWLLRAQPQESYTLLAGIAQLENSLIRFGNDQILEHRYGGREIHRKKMRQALDRFKHALHLVAIDMKGADEQKLLTRFIDAKQRMQQVLASRNPSSPSVSQTSAQTSRKIVQEAERIFRARAKALSPQQRHLFSLISMETILGEITTSYLLQGTSETKELTSGIAAFEREIRSCQQYSAASMGQKEALARIVRTWGVLKSYLDQSGLDLIVELGAAGTASMIRSLRISLESDG